MDQNNSNGAQPQLGASTFATSAASDEAVERKVNELLEREQFKQRTKAIIEEYVGSVAFMKKVQEYASEEVKRCYSTDRYEDFEKAVVTIVHGELASDPARKNLDVYVDGRARTVMNDDRWKKLTFWIPTVIAAAAVVVAILKP